MDFKSAISLFGTTVINASRTYFGSLDTSVTGTTQSTTDNSTKIATTQFVKNVFGQVLSVVQNVSDYEATGTVSTNMPVPSMSVSLSAGTWLVYAGVSGFTTDVVDGLQVALFDADSIPVTPIETTKGQITLSAVNSARAITTTCVVSPVATTNYGVVLVRNGTSTPALGDSGANSLTSKHRIIAVKIA